MIITFKNPKNPKHIIIKAKDLPGSQSRFMTGWRVVDMDTWSVVRHPSGALELCKAEIEWMEPQATHPRSAEEGMAYYNISDNTIYVRCGDDWCAIA